MSKIHTQFPELNQEFNNASSHVNNDRGHADIGGGFEYRFTPHISIFGEADYNWVSGGHIISIRRSNFFFQINFGFRYAF
jgi:hypothetical protein